MAPEFNPSDLNGRAMRLGGASWLGHWSKTSDGAGKGLAADRAEGHGDNGVPVRGPAGWRCTRRGQGAGQENSPPARPESGPQAPESLRQFF